MNVVLGGRLPPIVDCKSNLPRKSRVVQAQLRSEWCNSLNVYWSRIDRAIPHLCPASGGSPYATSHIFNCPANPTSLRPMDLWTQPLEAEQFIGIDLQTEPPIEY